MKSKEQIYKEIDKLMDMWHESNHTETNILRDISTLE